MIIKTNANTPVDPLKLDQTGEFLQTGHSSLDKKPQKESHQLAEWEKLFLKEAFFLYENKDRILSDINMALTPTPFKNGLAYTGSSGLGDATLGVYLEWWDACRKSVIKNGEKAYALTYRIACAWRALPEEFSVELIKEKLFQSVVKDLAEEVD